MKRTRIYLVLTLLSLVFVFTSCKKESARSCEELSTDFNNAITAFGTNPSEATCNGYKDAWHDYVDGCTTLSPAIRAQYDDILDGMDCTTF